MGLMYDYLGTSKETLNVIINCKERLGLVNNRTLGIIFIQIGVDMANIQDPHSHTTPIMNGIVVISMYKQYRVSKFWMTIDMNILPFLLSVFGFI